MKEERKYTDRTGNRIVLMEMIKLILQEPIDGVYKANKYNRLQFLISSIICITLANTLLYIRLGLTKLSYVI